MSFASDCVHNYSYLVFSLSLNFICFILSIIFYGHCLLPFSPFWLCLVSCLHCFSPAFLVFCLLIRFPYFLYSYIFAYIFFAFFAYIFTHLFVCFVRSPLFSPDIRRTAGFSKVYLHICWECLADRSNLNLDLKTADWIKFLWV
jgi:hypothetical protein